MASIQGSWSSLGVGSGLDLEGLVSGLMDIERRPLATLKTQVGSYNTKISALGTLQSKLSSLQAAAKDLKPSALQSSLDKFGTFTGTVSEEKVASAEIGSGATTGSYSLEVEQLAQGQKTRISGLGSGQIEFTFTDSSKNFSVTPASGDLKAVANAINLADKGVSATVIDNQLVLTGKEGEANAFNVSGAGLSGATQTQVQGAQNAKLSIDDIAFESESNTVKDAVTGVTLNLKSTTTAPVTLSVGAEYGSKLKEKLESFVKAFNDVVANVKSAGAYDPDSKTAGALNGNRILRDTQNTLRNLVFEQSSALGSNGEAMTLSQLGISFTAEGTLALDADKLSKAVTDDPALVANFAAEIGTRFNDGIDKLAGIGGTVQSATDSLKSSLTNLEKRQTAMEDRLESVEARYRKQFSALDVLVSSMNSTSSYLAQQLASLSAN
ncbi:MAG: flagellar filament capping protein FliD [Azoarcus sp.]|nr:flagellar filament capping protein FliD [Azoarcus sp.]